MTDSRRKKLIVMWIVLIFGTVLLSVGFNAAFFHQDAVKAEPGHYEARVYITNYGECYHSYSCGYLYASKIPIGLQEAKNSGYRACSVCGGSSSGSIYIEGKEGQKEENHYIAAFFVVLISVTSWVGAIWYNWIDDSESKSNNLKS